jgi:hypothetical protein
MFVQIARALDACSDFEWLCVDCCISFLNYPKITAAWLIFLCSAEPVAEGRRLDIENNAGGNLIEMTNKMQLCRKMY